MGDTDNAVVDGLMTGAVEALREFSTFDQERVDAIVEAAARRARDAHAVLARAAVDETGRGNFEDKTVKNVFASQYVADHMKGMKTVGVISEDDFAGMVEIAEPVGVVAAVTPVTNPTSTVIFKSLICLKTRNPVVFGFHPSAQSCSALAAKIVYEAALEAGAPKNCIQWIEEPSMENTTALMNHPSTSVILATGGNAMVRAAYSCGRPALGVGAGNVPAYIHRSADVKGAVYSVVASKSFDNGVICASEQAVILDDEIREQALAEFATLGGYLLSVEEMKKIEQLLFGANAFTEEARSAKLNPRIVGHSAVDIAAQAGVEVPAGTAILLAECSEVSYDEPLTREKLSPVLAVLSASSDEEGIALAAAMVEQDGLGHTAGIHARDREVIGRFAHAVKAIRVVENAPTSQGAIGGIYNSLIPSLTLGCGSYGHNSVSNNVSAVNLINIKHVARRNPVIRPFRVPAQIFSGSGSIRRLGAMEFTNVTVLTDADTIGRGILDQVLTLVYTRNRAVSVQIVDDVPARLSVDYLRDKITEVAAFRPQNIIAVGRRPVINAAKFVRLGVARPDIDMADVVAENVALPEVVERPQLVCISTVNGGQAAVAPKAGFFDPRINMTRVITSPSFLPSAVIIDPDLPVWDKQAAVLRGFQTITQATEAYFSVDASDFTDALAVHGLEIAYRAMPAVISEDEGTPEYESASAAIVSASCLVSTALGNTSLGLGESLAEAVHVTYGVNRRSVRPIVMPNVVRFNARAPRRFVTSPNYDFLKVPAQCAALARQLGIAVKGKDEAGAVESYASALEELRTRSGVAATLAKLGISRKAFDKGLDAAAEYAFDHASRGGNPQTAKIADIRSILRACFDGVVWTGAEEA